MSWAVVGMGAAASVGSSVDELFAALCAGRSGVAGLRGFDRARFNTQHAYEIDDRPAPGVDEPARASRLLLRAIEAALADAGLPDDLRDVPVLVGTGLRELRTVELWWRDGTPLDAGGLHFGTALRERFGAVDTHTVSNACSASLYTLALGTDLLAIGEADTVVVAGVDVITESMFGLVERVHPVPPERVRPFDRNRRGVLMGDGAAAVVLRRAADVTGPVRGVVRSVGTNCDAHHVTAPDPAGIGAAIRQAWERAGVDAGDIDLVMLHGTGTLLNDEAEAAAVAEVFGDQVKRPVMSGIKSMIGHTSGASGLIGLIVALRSLATGAVPPTIGLDDPVDEAMNFRFATSGERYERMSLAQVNAFGFGGINAVAIVEGVR
ncbi:MAG TPA: beta-ketoacyl synthase N-terminal-like domain-containing protein [Micromonospora sp.]